MILSNACVVVLKYNGTFLKQEGYTSRILLLKKIKLTKSMTDEQALNQSNVEFKILLISHYSLTVHDSLIPSPLNTHVKW